ncbi:MAG: hypothetical protein ACTSPY_06420 [Candidatus Helarchaeota archaeon]
MNNQNIENGTGTKNIDQNNKNEHENRNYFKNFILIFGIFYLLLGIMILLFIMFLIAFIPVEYITYLNEFFSRISPFNLDLFTIIDMFGIFFIILGILFIFESFLINFRIKFWVILGIVLSTLQIWVFPLGTFVGYIIYSELLHN